MKYNLFENIALEYTGNCDFIPQNKRQIYQQDIYLTFSSIA